VKRGFVDLTVTFADCGAKSVPTHQSEEEEQEENFEAIGAGQELILQNIPIVRAVFR